VGKTCLEDLELGFEDDSYSQWRKGEVDHLEVQAQVCQEACHRRVPSSGVP